MFQPVIKWSGSKRSQANDSIVCQSLHPKGWSLSKGD